MEQDQVTKTGNASQSAITPSASVGSNNFTDQGSVSEANGCNNVSACGDVTNAELSHWSNTAAVNATSQMSVNQDSLRAVSLLSVSDSNKQCAVTFLRDLDMYFEIKKVPQNLTLSPVLRAIKDPFAQN
jgi:hypothetical protein